MLVYTLYYNLDIYVIQSSESLKQTSGHFILEVEADLCFEFYGWTDPGSDIWDGYCRTSDADLTFE